MASMAIRLVFIFDNMHPIRWIAFLSKSVRTIVSGLTLNIFTVILGGMGLVAVQAEVVRQAFLNTTKQEFAKALPQIAEQQQGEVLQAVKKCFETYEAEVTEQINGDIAARRSELVNLLNQKESYDVNRESESTRLNQIEMQMKSSLEQLSTLQQLATKTGKA
jgi:cobalamin biosynthesis protein CobD/CbiB